MNSTKLALSMHAVSSLTESVLYVATLSFLTEYFVNALIAALRLYIVDGVCVHILCECFLSALPLYNVDAHLCTSLIQSNAECVCTVHSQADRVFYCELCDSKLLYCQYMVPMSKKQLN